MPNRSRNAAASAGDDSGASANFTLCSRSFAAGGVASTYDSARPTVLKYVAPTARRSSRNADAENRRRSAIVAPEVSAGTKFDASALPWNSGIGQYRTSSGPNGMRSPMRANRPWVPRTALGVPVEPDVKISTNSVSGPGRSAGIVAPACRGAAAAPGVGLDGEDVVGGDAEVEAVEERAGACRR